MSNIYTSIYSILADSGGALYPYFSGLTLSQQIVNIENDENKSFPQIFFTKLTDTTSWNNPDRWQSWRFYFRHYTHVQSKQIRDAAYTMLNRGTGEVGTFWISFIQCEDIGADPIKINNFYECYSDYRICYNSEV